MFEDFEILRFDPHYQVTRYFHCEESIWELLIWEDEPNFLDENGNCFPGSRYEFKDEEGLTARIIDSSTIPEFQADEISNDHARGRRDCDTTGVFESLKHKFSLTDPNWVDVTGANLYAS